MKTKIIVACTAAALVITLIACGLFGSKEKETAFDIRGQWIIDSIGNKGSDSSANMAALLLAMSQKDSLPVGIQFNSDSSYQLVNTVDTVKGNYYLSEDNNSLFVREDSAYTQFNFLEKSDSVLSMSTLDSVVYYLRKK